MNVCFIMYPWEHIDAEKDTSLALIRECVKRKHGVAMCTPSNLTIRDGLTNAFCKVVGRMEKVSNSLKSFGTSNYVILQDNIKGADQGDVRILLLNGEPVGAMRRIPGSNDHRSNVSAGGITYINKVYKNIVKVEDRVIDFVESKVMDKVQAFNRRSGLRKTVEEA